MSWWYWWCFFIFLLSLFQTCFLSSPPSPSPSPQLCLHDVSSALLHLKQKHFHDGVYYNYYVDQDYKYHSLNSWKPNTDCCCWEGITCDGTTGHLVGLDLSISSLNGSIHSNSSLFHLHHLRMLNLSMNEFDYFAPSGFDRLPRLMHLDLSRNYFSGQIPSQISQLTDLVSLNLSDNLFEGQIPSEISRLTNLVSLDISYNYVFPRLEIPNLRAFAQNLSTLRELRLNVVNLSARENRDWCRHLSSALPNLHVLSMMGCSLTGPLDASISSLCFLSELYLDGNSNISSTVPSSLMNLTSLTVLSLRDCGFHGYFPSNVFLHPKLQYIDLSENPLLSGHFPEFPQVNSALQCLDASKTKFQGKLPSSLMNLTSLTDLRLSDCGFHGDFPSNVFLHPMLQYIDLSKNPLLSGHFPEFPQVNRALLQYLNVGKTKFQGKLPSSLGNLKFLEELHLGDCNFSGPIPRSLANLTHLTLLDLSNNSFNGQIPSLERFPNLEHLLLGNNLLQGPIHSYLFFLPSMSLLDLSYNQFSGIINELIHNTSSFSSPMWEEIHLRGNNLKGQDLMRLIYKIEREIGFLDFSFNDFGYMVEDTTNLSYHSLSINPSGDNFVNALIRRLWMTSCNISKFPDFLRNQKKLVELDLSSNRIDGAIPKWIWQSYLMRLNLSENLFIGLDLPLPNHSVNILSLDLHSNMIQDYCLSTADPCFSQISNHSKSEFVSPILGNLMFLLSEASSFFSISDNNLTGKIPFSICNASKLDVLDLSKNQLSGTIPACLGSNSLGVLNLERNKLHGPIPPTFKNGCRLHTLYLNENMLQGELPRTLGNCKELTVLNVADNQLNGTFPYWLEKLSELQVLVMRSNKFGGPIAQLPQSDSPFPSLHVIDLSFNYFTGYLPLQYICHWKAMMFDEDGSKLNFTYFFNFTMFNYQDTLVIMEKGLYLNMQRILTTFTAVDLSNNNFEGNIPDALGILKSLKVLNLSGNSLMGQIPFSLGNLRELESLDLSRNKLSGEIPRQLTSLTFLAVLNLSYNNFVGSIPQGKQFNTFSNTSYEGNAGLCGLPLSRKCGITDGALPPTSALQQNDDSACLFDWKFALAGYCSGLIIGVVTGQELFWRKGRFFKFFSRALVSKRQKRTRKINHRNRGK